MPSLTMCAFNLSLVRAIAGVVGREGRAVFNLGAGGSDYWAPNVNPVRDVRWGRAQEVPTEDPGVAGQWAVEYVRGLQEGPDARFLQQAATLKHFAFYDFESFNGSTRGSFNVHVSDQDAADSYLAPFAAAVQLARPAGVMASYTARDGVPSVASRALLTTLLRDAWGFDGYVTGDCNAVRDVATCPVQCHNYTATNATAAAAVLASGATMDCGGVFETWLPEALASGVVAQAAVDAAAAANLAVRVRAGVFDDPATQPMAAWGREALCTPDAAALSARAAEEGMVLLKNAGGGRGLPLDAAAVKTVALLGGNANDSMAQLCSYYSEPCGGYAAMVTTLAALPAFAAVDFAPGCADAACANASAFPAALAAAARADAVVLQVGLNCRLVGEDRDRTSLALPGATGALVAGACAAAAARARPCVVALNAGAGLDVSALLADDNVTAILFAGYGGPAAGTALARALFGAAAPPAGRLATAWYTERLVQEVDPREMGMRPGPSAWPPGTNPGHTHRFYNGEALLFPFGFGLSYTTFAYANLHGPAEVSLRGAAAWAAPAAGRGAAGALALSVAAGERAAALFSVDVENAGAVDADDVVLAFLEPPGAGAGGVPRQELVFFSRVRVRAGAAARVDVPLPLRALTQVGASGERAALAGRYTLRVGVRAAAAAGGGGGAWARPPAAVEVAFDAA